MNLGAMRHNAERIQRDLDALRRQIEIAERQDARCVVVQFHGNTRRYTYEMAPGYSMPEVGDYVKVYSPHSDQSELVRVVATGENDRPPHLQGNALKHCHRINWQVCLPDEDVPF